MTTCAEAIKRISEDTGIDFTTVYTAARRLWEADDDLWPRQGRGGGATGAKHVNLSHLENLVLVLAMGDGSKRASEIVRQWRGAGPIDFSRPLSWDHITGYTNGLIRRIVDINPEFVVSLREMAEQVVT